MIRFAYRILDSNTAVWLWTVSQERLSQWGLDVREQGTTVWILEDHPYRRVGDMTRLGGDVGRAISATTTSTRWSLIDAIKDEPITMTHKRGPRTTRTP